MATKRISRTLLVSALLLALATSAQQARATPITYQFTAYSSFPLQPDIVSLQGTFTFTAPGFITTDTTVLSTALDSCSISSPIGFSCANMGFRPDFYTGTDMISFGVSNATSIYYYFNDGAFSTLGDHTTIMFGTDQAGRLTVREAKNNGQVPEPASLALLGLGLAGLGAMRRRKA